MRRKFISTVIAAMGLLPGLASAQGIGLPAAGFAAGGTGLTSFYVIGFELGPWQEYLAQELTPDYMLPDDAKPVHVTWLRTAEVNIFPDFAAGIQPVPETWINLQFEYQSATEFLWQGVEPEPRYEGSSFERQYFTPGVEHAFGDGGILGVSAVVAYQRYSAASLGLFAASEPGADFGFYSGYQPYQDSGFGTGVKLAVHQEVTSGIALDAGFQSRISTSRHGRAWAWRSRPANAPGSTSPSNA